MTNQEWDDMVDALVPVHPDATDETKLQGKNHRLLLKTLFRESKSGGFDSIPFDWTVPSNAFGGYSNSEKTFLKGMWKFLHRDTPPSCSLSASQPERERGASSSVTLSYSVAQGTADIQSIRVDTVNLPATALSGSVVTQTQPNTNTTFTMEVRDKSNNSATAQARVEYKDRRFAFSTTTDLFNAGDAAISTFLRTAGGELSTGRQFSKVVNCQNSELYVAYPLNFGNAASIYLGTFEDDSFTNKLFNYTNANGFTMQYILYKSGNKLFDDYTVTIN